MLVFVPMKLKEDSKNLLLLFLIALLGLGLRLYHLDLFPLWGDEAFTRFYSESSLSYLWTTGFQLETNPPGYYTLMHAWMLLFGTGEAALRLPSVLASTLSIVLVYALGRELEDAKVGLIGALVMAFAPSNLWSAQEVRTYAWTHVPIGVVLLSTAWFLARPSLGSLIAFAAGALAAVYSHDTAVLLVAACNLAVLCAAFGGHPLVMRRDLVRWMMTNGIVALVLLPLVLTMWSQRTSVNIAWVPPLSAGNFVAMLSEIIGGTAGHAEFPHCRQFLLLAVLALALRPLYSLHRRTVVVLIIVPLFFTALTLILSVKHSIMMPRMFFWCLIPLSLLIAIPMARATRMRWAVLAMTVVCFLPGLIAQLSPKYNPKEDWRNFLAANREQFSKSETIVLGPATTIASLVYYYPEGVSRMKFWPGEPQAKCDFSKSFMCEKFKIPKIATNEMLAAITSGQRISLLLCLTDGKYVKSPSSPVPAPARRFDDITPNGGELYLLSWNNN